MSGKQTQHEYRHELNELADRLRRLPAPQVPAGLKDRLVAALPADLSAKRTRRRPWRWTGVAIGAASAAAILLLVLHGAAGRRLASKGVAPSAGCLASVDAKEIDPCNILPLLPDGR